MPCCYCEMVVMVGNSLEISLVAVEWKAVGK